MVRDAASRLLTMRPNLRLRHAPRPHPEGAQSAVSKDGRKHGAPHPMTSRKRHPACFGSRRAPCVLSTLCTRGYGCATHPAFPAPFSFDWANAIAKLGRILSRGCGDVSSLVPDAVRRATLLRSAGTHQQRCEDAQRANDGPRTSSASRREMRRAAQHPGHKTQRPAPSSPSTSSTSSIVIRTGLSPRSSRPSLRPPR
jgi:hypothetical protein